MPQEIQIALIAAAALTLGTVLSVVTSMITARQTRSAAKEDRAAVLEAEAQRWMQTRDAEHQVWLRDQKQEAYWDFLQVVLTALQTPADKADAATDSLMKGLTRTRLLGSPEVYDAVVEVHSALLPMFIGSPTSEELAMRLDQLAEPFPGHVYDMVLVMRKDLGIHTDLEP